MFISKLCHSRHLFFIFFHSIVQFLDEILSMSGFKLQISGVGSDRSANCATTTALSCWYLSMNRWRTSFYPRYYKARCWRLECHQSWRVSSPQSSLHLAEAVGGHCIASKFLSLPLNFIIVGGLCFLNRGLYYLSWSSLIALISLAIFALSLPE